MAAGYSISPESLHPADIIVSTAIGAASTVIRAGGFSKISHAKLYLDGGSLIEAIGEGVVIRPLEQAIAHDTLTIVLRHKLMNQSKAQSILRDAMKYVGKKYDYTGVANASPGVTKGFAMIVSPLVAIGTAHGLASNLIDQDAKFFCSELVARMYENAHTKILNVPAYQINPDQIYTSSNLQYVGNLKGAEN